MVIGNIVNSLMTEYVRCQAVPRYS